MLFSEILGLEHLKNHLCGSADRGRIPHAQLFVGKSGSGTLPMAIAYAQYILCSNTNSENTTGNESCNLKFKKLAHPDLHFAFPVASTAKIQTKPVSSYFLEEWRTFVKENPYGNLFDWYQAVGIERKQGNISVHEAQDIVKSLSLKAYEGGYKVMLIWGADKLNMEASNKLLKLIEEPPAKTVFLLISDNEQQILQTIRSRCQVIHFPPLGEKVIEEALINFKQVNQKEAKKIAHQAQGNYRNALHILEKDETDAQFEKWFINWVRTAFRAKGNKTAINALLNWSEEISKQNREVQKRFLNYCLDFFRQALLQNYTVGKLVYLEPNEKKFQLEKFAPFVHGGNIIEIVAQLEEAIYHIERNTNSKMVLTDLSIKLTRLLHRKETA